MHETFAALIGGLHPKFEQLIGMTPCRAGAFPRACRSEASISSAKATRISMSADRTRSARAGDATANPGATHRMAAFALKLARETTGKLTASYEDDETAART
jgi:hypothetical protein